MKRPLEQLARSTRAQRLRGRLSTRAAVGKGQVGRVFTYHGLVHERSDDVLERNFHTVAEFRAHLRELDRCRVVPLGDLLGPQPPGGSRRPTVALTFDDGYANNSLAGELLADRALPWTIFPSTGAVGTPGTIWTVEVSLLLLHGQAAGLELLDRTWSLRERADREAAFGAIRSVLKEMASAQRRAALDAIRAQFPAAETERLVAEFSSFRMATWDDLRSLSREGVDVGSHGVHHELHNSAQPRTVVELEVQRSRRDIEDQLGVTPETFAYPNGNRNDVSADVLHAAGYTAGLTTEPDVVTTSTPPFAVPRFNAPRSTAAFVRALHV